jgi:DNA polymerase/3'-5' exonuclease PolX
MTATAGGLPKTLPTSQLEQLQLLETLGYEVPPHMPIVTSQLTPKFLQQTLETWKSQVDYAMDGLVICPIDYQLEMVDTPEFKVAFKGINIGQWTTVTSIVPRATRTGLVIPQVYVAPVIVDGATITTVAGANYNMLLDKGITVGIEAYVVKANTVIPFIEAVRTPTGAKLRPLKIPAVCPSCGSELSSRKRILRCDNQLCPEKLSGSIEYFLKHLSVTGFGKTMVDRLSVISPTIEDLYHLTVKEMTKIEGFGTIKAQSLYQQLRDKIHPITQADLLTAIGPPSIGHVTAKLVVEKIPIEELFGDKPVTLSQLTTIRGLGQSKASVLYNYQDKGRTLLHFLKQQGLVFTRSRSSEQKTEVICLTGKGSKTRAQYENLISQRGWDMAHTVTSRVTILVSSGIESAKTTKARAMGIKVITYQQLETLLSKDTQSSSQEEDTQSSSQEEEGNQKIIKILTQLIIHTQKKWSTAKGDEKKKHFFRLTQFKKALQSIKTYPHQIKSGQQALKLKLDGVGEGIARRIDEILQQGTLQQLEETIAVDPETQIMTDLETVSGIGETLAKKLIEQGVTSVKDLRRKEKAGAIELTHQAHIGLKYHEDFQEKIPYQQVSELGSMIKHSVHELYPTMMIEICGSHRRQAAFSGDIDVLMTDPTEDLDPTDEPLLHNIVQALKDDGIIVDDITTQGQTKYMGVCVHPDDPIKRRIDIRFVSYDSFYPALVYFTGSMQFNKLMRTEALKHHYTLNEYGLYHYEGHTKGAKVVVHSEKELFDLLEMTYLEPSKRNL